MRMFLCLACLISVTIVVHGQTYGRSRTRPVPTYPVPVPTYPEPVPTYPEPVPTYPQPVPTYPEPAPTCRWGSEGPCRRGQWCPTGSTCQRNQWSQGSGGTCCRNRPDTPECHGTCLGWANAQCSSGYTCRRIGGTLGECCRTNQQCDEFCGGIAGIQCPTGKTCVLVGQFPDAGGKCCTNSNGNNNGRCPSNNGPRPMGRRCVIDPNVNCYRDDECPGTAKCCDHNGCGKVCKNPVFDTRW